MYRVNGNRILHNGSEIQLFGANWIGFETAGACIHGLWSNGLEAMVRKLKELRYNHVRLPIGPMAIKETTRPGDGLIDFGQNRDLDGLSSLQILDAVIDSFERHGIRYVFDWHYLENGIPPLWYTDRYSEDQWLTDLSFLANRYQGQPGFVGIDIKNEPKNPVASWGGGDAKTDFKMATELAFDAIDAVNSDILVIYEAGDFRPGVTPLVKNPPNIPSDRRVPSIHIYGPSLWGDQFSDQWWDESFGNVCQDAPVYIGEYGAIYPGKDKAWQDAFINYLLRKKVLNTAVWGYTKSSHYADFGILSGERVDEVNKQRNEAIQRLWTPLATFTTDRPKPVPVPEPEPKPEPAPAPVGGELRPGDHVQFLTGKGPTLVVGRITAEKKIAAAFFNEVSGRLEEVTCDSVYLKRV